MLHDVRHGDVYIQPVENAHHECNKRVRLCRVCAKECPLKEKRRVEGRGQVSQQGGLVLQSVTWPVPQCHHAEKTTEKKRKKCRHLCEGLKNNLAGHMMNQTHSRVSSLLLVSCCETDRRLLIANVLKKGAFQRVGRLQCVLEFLRDVDHFKKTHWPITSTLSVPTGMKHSSGSALVFFCRFPQTI